MDIDQIFMESYLSQNTVTARDTYILRTELKIVATISGGS